MSAFALPAKRVALFRCITCLVAVTLVVPAVLLSIPGRTNWGTVLAAIAISAVAGPVLYRRYGARNLGTEVFSRTAPAHAYFRRTAVWLAIVPCVVAAYFLSWVVSPLWIAAPLVVVGLAYGIFRAPVHVAAGVLLITPFLPLPILALRHLGFAWVMPASALKEVALVLAGLALARRRSPKLCWPDLLFVALLGTAVLVSLIHLNSSTAIGLKDDLDFLVAFFAGSVLPLDRRWIKVAIVAAAVLSILGLIEVLFLGFDTRVLLIGSENVTPSFAASHFSGLRASSLLAGPLDFGVFCAAATLLYAAFYKQLPKYYFAFVPILVAALVATLTRMAWLGLAVGLAVIAIKTGQKMKFAMAGLLLAALALAVAIPTMDLQDFVDATLHGREQSMEGHMDSMLEKWTYIATHPFGSGAGTVGPRAESRNPAARHVESGYLQFGMEYGWLGLLLSASACSAIVIKLLRSRSEFGIAAAAVAAAMVTALIFSPVHMEFSLSWIWALLGYAVHERHAVASEVALRGIR